jgi:adenylosuccinate synthase
MDAVLEKSKGKNKIGSTLKGIGPTYTDKISRSGLRIGNLETSSFFDLYKIAKERHLSTISQLETDFDQFIFDGLPFSDYENAWFEALETLKKLNKINSEYYLNNALESGKRILAEGAQGTMLDIDFGSYPFVTSSNTTTAGMCTGLGIAPSKVGKVYGIFKAYCTRVGSGPFPTELLDKDGDQLRNIGHEFGSTTGRPRRCGWMDIPALKYSIMLNGVTELMMMKADVMNTFPEIKVATQYQYDGKTSIEVPFDETVTQVEPVYTILKGWNTEIPASGKYDTLPEELTQYVQFIEKETDVPVTIVSTGPDRSQTIFK